jgi:hypothetical protein
MSFIYIVCTFESLQIKREGDSWRLVGAIDMGSACANMDVLKQKKKEVKLATHVLQFAYTGFTGFRWPVAYYASATATAQQLYMTTMDLVDSLDDYGFTVDYVLMDGASTNRSFTKMVLENPRESVTTTNVFDHTNTITFTQDIKHTFKKVRNGLESSKLANCSDGAKGRVLCLNGKNIVWDHWVSAAEYNVQGGYRMHRKLTKEHIELSSTSKMRNKLATDVLDMNMLRLMKEFRKSVKQPEELDSTVAVLEHTAVLVDIFLDVNRPITDVSDKRLVLMKDALNFFNMWEEDVKADPKLSVKKHLLTQETRDDLNSAILGFSDVAHKLIKLSHPIRPGYFNSDLIENVFCQQRGINNGCCTNPTVNQYGPGINAIVIGQLAVSRKSNSGQKTLHFGATTSRPLKRKPAGTSKCKAPVKKSLLRL